MHRSFGDFPYFGDSWSTPLWEKMMLFRQDFFPKEGMDQKNNIFDTAAGVIVDPAKSRWDEGTEAKR